MFVLLCWLRLDDVAAVNVNRTQLWLERKSRQRGHQISLTLYTADCKESLDRAVFDFYPRSFCKGSSICFFF